MGSIFRRIQWEGYLLRRICIGQNFLVWHPSWQAKGYLKNVVLLKLFPILVALEHWGEFFRNYKLLILKIPSSHRFN